MKEKVVVDGISQTPTTKHMVLAVITGILVATSPTWLAKDAPHSNYDAPWIYPGDVAPR